MTDEEERDDMARRMRVAVALMPFIQSVFRLHGIIASFATRSQTPSPKTITVPVAHSPATTEQIAKVVADFNRDAEARGGKVRARLYEDNPP